MKMIIETLEDERYINASPRDKVKDLSDETIQAISESVNKLSDQFWKGFHPIKRPKEIELEFGLSVDANADILIVKSTVEANFKITLKWSLT